MVLTRALTLLAAILVASPAFAGTATTRDAITRLEGVFQVRIDEGKLRRRDLLPAIVVSMDVRYEESKDWFAPEALAALARMLGPEQLRVCEACMAPSTHALEGRVEYRSGPLSMDEILRFDEAARGTAPPARAAIWIDETSRGVGIKVVELSTSRVLFAQNIDPELRDERDTEQIMRASAELERRVRGDSLTHLFFDATLYPGQHVSLDWTDQWGETNRNFTGVTLSAFDPVAGFGLVYYRVIGVWDIAGFPIAPQVGGKVVLSLPTAIIEGITGEDTDALDPILSGVFVLRIPFGRSNYALLATASTNLRFGVGISLLNVSFLPVLP